MQAAIKDITSINPDALLVEVMSYRGRSDRVVWLAKKTGENETVKEYIRMSERENQESEIESMRNQLHELVVSKAGNLIDEEVGKLSTQLMHWL